ASSITLQQNNLASTPSYLDVGTGTDISTVAPIVTLPVDQRQPVNLTIKSNNIQLNAGVTVTTDPQAIIKMAGSQIPNATDPLLMEQHAGVVRLLGSIVDHGGTVAINAVQTLLGPQASIDLSGTFIPSSRFVERGGSLTSGTLLPGGTFAVEALQPLDLQAFQSNGVSFSTDPSLAGSSVLAATGAIVDVSGSAGFIETFGGRRDPIASEWSWSDAGTVSVDAGAFMWGGTLKAAGGDPRASNGTIILGGSNVWLTQAAPLVSLATNPGALIIAPVAQLAAFD